MTAYLKLYCIEVPTGVITAINFSNNFLHSLDLFSKIATLQSDTLSDQRSSTTPHTTPEPEGRTPPSSESGFWTHSHDDLLKRSPGESRKRASSTGKRPSSNTDLSHKMLTVSKSIGVLNHGTDKRHRDDQRYHNHYASKLQFKRVQSGSSISNTQKAIHRSTNRSVSPPASIGYDEGRRTSPPPPTTKPPPLPMDAKRSRANHNTRWPNSSKTDSVSSEDSDPNRGRHRHLRHNNSSEHIYENRMGEGPQFFPQAHPNQDGPVYVNTGAQERHRSYAKNRPVHLSSLSKEKHSRSRASMMPSPPRDDAHPLDNFVTEAYTQRKSGHSGQKKQVPATNQPLTNYPWHHARKTSGHLTSSKRRKDLTENSDLIQRGNEIIRKDMNDFHSHALSDGSSSNSGSGKTPLSPTTHTLTVSENPACETFV